MKALLVAVLACGCAGLGAAEAESQGRSILPCDKRDHAAQKDLAANAARSKLERDACKGDAACVGRVLAERDAFVFERCKLPEGAQ